MDFNAILAQLRNGQAREARAALDAARAAGDDTAPVNGLLARACLALGDRAGARAALEAGLARDRSFGPLWLERAMLARLEGDVALLVASLREAHRLMPQQPGVTIDLANALAATQQYAQAEAVLAPLVAAQPTLAPAWLASGKVALAAGDATRAHDCFAHAQRLAPNDTVALEGLAESADAIGRLDGALWARQRLAQLAPGDLGAQVALADVLRRQDRNEEARDAFARAISLGSRDPLVRWLRWQSLPLVARSRAHAQELADDWDRELGEWEQWVRTTPPALPQAAALISSATNFFRHYLGGDIAAVQARYGALLGALAAIAFADGQPGARSGARRRIAFASPHLRRHTVANYFGAWLERLDRERFEVHAIHLDPTPDATTAQLRARVDGWHEVAEPRAAIDGIAALGFDAIVHLDVGMHPLSQAMASVRLAPFQAAAWGHPVTTGLATIDAFLSSDWMEPAEGDAQYSERLVRLPRLGACIARPDATPDRGAVAQAGLAGRPYFFCPQSVSKLTPAHDALFARIAAACPGHRIVVVPSHHAHVNEALRARMAGAFDAADVDPSRLQLVPMVPHAQFLGLVQGASALLDTMEFSGGNTSIDAIACGTPIVTLPGTTMRARQTAAMLRGIGLADGIATDVDDYVARAVAFAGADVRREASAAVAAHAAALFDQPDSVGALADLLDEATPR